ncbi:MAG: DNA internalization-related competence protein ComEC/Rec2 [Selenomonadaceae bacterium]|nr:DNA internalization-related competence protein ComEC/Rec2 [Selenomonadaceae bacterium]
MKIKVTNTMLNYLLAAMVAGILFMEYFNPTLKTFLEICASVSAGVIIATWKKNSATLAKIISLIIFFVIGALRFYGVDNLPADDISKFEGQTLKIVGTIRDEPQIKIFPNEMTQQRFIVEISSAGKNPASGAMILTSYYKAGEELKPARIGDKISAEGKIKFITNYKNPGQIDMATRLKSDGITARMSAGKNGVEIEQVDGNFWTKFLRWVASIREHYKDSMSKVMSSEDAAAIFAMLFGGYAGLNPELVEDFVTTGIVHILSVSGSHMSLLAAATAALCLILKLPRWLTVFLAVLIIGTYTLLSGMLPQVVRSAIMGILVFVGTAARFEFVSARFLTLTALAMLINQPLLIFDISFQLSFSSTAGLMYLAPDLRIFMRELPRWVSIPAAMTLSAQIASLPVVIWYFNQVSLSSVLANVFVMPLLEIVIVGGLLGGLVALLIPFLGKIFFFAESLIFSTGAELNRLFANLPFSAVQVPTLGIAAGAIYYLALIFRRAEILFLLIVLLAVNFFKAGGDLEVSFVDVGQGDCCVVLTPNRKCLIFDAGGVREKTFDVGGRVVIPYLKHENIFAVDTIFLTHAHEDHSGGAGTIIKKMPVREIITANESKSEYAAVFGISEQKLNNLRAGQSGETFNIDGVEIKILYAPKIGTGNEISNVYKISYGNVSFLITGDLISEIESDILRENINVQSTVLKVAHHGSKTSSSEEFLKSVNPRVAVICVGYGNNFNHPRAEILERLEKINAKIFRTDIDGLIKFKTDGKSLTVKTFSE